MDDILKETLRSRDVSPGTAKCGRGDRYGPQLLGSREQENQGEKTVRFYDCSPGATSARALSQYIKKGENVARANSPPTSTTAVYCKVRVNELSLLGGGSNPMPPMPPPIKQRRGRFAPVLTGRKSALN